MRACVVGSLIGFFEQIDYRLRHESGSSHPSSRKMSESAKELAYTCRYCS
jgi:hypothetical protein